MKTLLILFSCLYAGTLPAQILYVAPGTDFTVKAGTDLTLDSIILMPSSDFVINDNTLTRSSSVTNTAIAGFHIANVYHFVQSTASFSGAVKFYYQDGAQLNGINEGDLRLHIHNGSQWNRYDAGFTNDPVNNYVLTTAVGTVSLNEITLASSAYVLPIRFINISAIRNASTIRVNWSAYQDADYASFVVEKSLNSLQWTALGAPLAAVGIGNKQYTITDYEYQPGVIYYRIKAVNKNGSYSYSAVAKVAAQKSFPTLSAYPNPLVSQFYLNYAGTLIPRELQLLDVHGAVVHTWKKMQSVYNVQRLPGGTYSLRLVFADGSIETVILTKL